MKLWLVSSLFLATVIVQGFALECHICENCGDLTKVEESVAQCSLDNVFPETPVTKPTEEPSTESTSTTQDTTTTTPETTTSTTTTTTTLSPTDSTTTTESTTVTIPTAPTPPLTTEGPITTVAVSRFNRQANPEFRCFTAEISNGTRRGCTRWLATDEATCTAIGGEGCRICNENKCNSASGLVASFLMILLAALFAQKML